MIRSFLERQHHVVFGASGALLLMVASASAEGWRFEAPDNATVNGSDGAVISVACGNAGTPILTIRPDPRPEGVRGETAPVLRLEIDGASHGHQFYCSAGQDCGSSGIEPTLFGALKAGSRLQFFWEDRPGPSFSLRGSGAALSQLQCLEPEQASAGGPVRAELPTYDIEATCNAYQANKTFSQSSYDFCIQSEVRTRDALGPTWNAASPGVQQECAGIAGALAHGDYSELARCLVERGS